MTIAEALAKMTQSLKEGDAENPLLDAQVLMAHALKVERYRLTVEERRELTAVEEGYVFDLLERRLRNEPVAYITGKKEFYSLEFIVNTDVLIPRPETELLVDLAIYYAPRGGRVLDLGTGSGAIAVSLKNNRKDLIVHATDISAAAVATAKKNAVLLLGDAEITFAVGDLFEPIGTILFDCIVSNPPYVNPASRKDLRPDLEYEPGAALYASDGGRAVIERIIEESSLHLTSGGILIIELCPDLKELVLEMGKKNGFHATVLNDYAGMARVGVLKKLKT